MPNLADASTPRASTPARSVDRRLIASIGAARRALVISVVVGVILTVIMGLVIAGLAADCRKTCDIAMTI